VFERRQATRNRRQAGYNALVIVRLIFLCGSVLAVAACTRSAPPLLEDLAGHADLRSYQLATLRGTRDGDRLQAQALLTDSSSMLTLDLRFTVGVPTTLRAGAWRWVRHNQLETGSVAARSVTFLGGQDGPPNLGGSFDLLAPDTSARYRVNLPVTALRR
jgi:hypothetical protein